MKQQSIQPLIAIQTSNRQYHYLIKTFTVAVVDILSFICLQKNSAVPLEEPMANDDPVAANQEMQVESWKINLSLFSFTQRPIPNRQKHDSQMICYRCCHTTSRGSTTCIMCCD
uniref:Uncharacterized protein n=1 Tax=Labrus bergylta TaxID=56723 RepID=A0A3Q3EFT0_9LABR